MAEDVGLNPLKRPRVGATTEELQRILGERDKEIEFLNKKFNYIVDENEKLRKNMDDLLKKFNCESDDEISSGDEMALEEQDIPLNCEGENVVKDKAENSAACDESLKKDQNIAVSGPTLKAKPKAKKEGSGRSGAHKDPSPRKTATKDNGRKSKSVPVITTYNIDLKFMNLKTLGKNVVNIGLCTLEDHDKVRALLVDRKVNFYTYTPKGQRPFSVVVEGLPHSFESGDILGYLNGLQINVNIIGLAKLGYGKWVVRMARNSDIAKFTKLGTFCVARCTLGNL